MKQRFQNDISRRFDFCRFSRELQKKQLLYTFVISQDSQVKTTKSEWLYGLNVVRQAVPAVLCRRWRENGTAEAELSAV